MNTTIEDACLVDCQLFWPALKVGRKYRTIDRTIVQSDFAKMADSPSSLDRQAGTATARIVPPELTFRIIEDVIASTFVHRVSPATIECWQGVLSPVWVGDTIHAIVEVEEIQPDWRTNWALVVLNVEVANHRGTGALSYTAAQMVECDRALAVRSGRVHIPIAEPGVRHNGRVFALSGSHAQQLIRTTADREQPNGRRDMLVRNGWSG
ncbi:MAG: hypothetical protein EOP82_00955 [Variovorax sp.]|nr:MAG: hypothetical protein EOP82_00955 [Variovorax sp.]